MFGMELGISAKKVSILCGGIWHARVAQHERKHRSEGSPHNEKRAEHSPPCSKGALQQRGCDVIARFIRADLVQLLPWQHAQYADVHHQVERADNDNGEQDRAWNVAFWPLDLGT